MKKFTNFSGNSNEPDTYKQEPHTTTALRLVYKLSFLIKEPHTTTALRLIYKLSFLIKEPHTTTALRLIYKLSLLLEEKKRGGGGGVNTLHLLNSLYKVALVLKELKKEPEEIASIIASIYRMALLLKEHKKTSDEIISSLILYMEGIMRIFRKEYTPANDKTITKNLEDAFSEGQLKSKFWLIQKLKDHNLSALGCVFSCAGWYGTLPFLLMTDSYFSIEKCFLLEKDPLSVRVSEDLNRHFVKQDWKFKASLQNILDVNYFNAFFNTLKADGTIQEIQAVPDTLINTACEHIENFELWWSKIPSGKLIILQSNDYFDLPDHINCVSSLEDFKKQADMDLLYEGVLELEAYRRFMLIGHKKS